MVGRELRDRVERIHTLSLKLQKKMLVHLENPFGIIIERGLRVTGIDLTQFVGGFTSIHSSPIVPTVKRMVIIELKEPFPYYQYNSETQLLKIVSG